MMISRINHGELVNWAAIMYSQLVKEFIRWEVLEKHDEGTTKREPKNIIWHSTIVLQVLFQKWFPLEGIEPHERKK
jgi:hypothetical protein